VVRERRRGTGWATGHKTYNNAISVDPLVRAASRIVGSGCSVTDINNATTLDKRSQSHTGTEVRVAAQGPPAANVVGITDQADLYHTMARALGVE
jgi:alkaline phosphatase